MLDMLDRMSHSAQLRPYLRGCAWFLTNCTRRRITSRSGQTVLFFGFVLFGVAWLNGQTYSAYPGTGPLMMDVHETYRNPCGVSYALDYQTDGSGIPSYPFTFTHI